MVLKNISPFHPSFGDGGGEVVREWCLAFLFLKLRDEKCHEHFSVGDQGFH